MKLVFNIQLPIFVVKQQQYQTYVRLLHRIIKFIGHLQKLNMPILEPL
ncbi:MAG: hypothetical protein HEQ20_17020 [Aphanizomenon flos-aquae KM1D3_PB]|nr:hypothetical protein [Aphanizomenon flos-aquae]QSV72130.1 MAG: hypothetical protein HEQ20_17020 [Aphanizomenon flos-aquae KM1D3_PB]